MSMFSNEYILSLIEANASQVFPIILPSLVEVSNFHWNKEVAMLSTSVIANFVSAQPKLFENITNQLQQKKKENKTQKLERAKRWKKLETQAEASALFKGYNEVSSKTF